MLTKRKKEKEKNNARDFVLFKTQCQKSSSYIPWEETNCDASDTLNKKKIF